MTVTLMNEESVPEKHLTREYAPGLRREPQIDHSIQGFEPGSIKQKAPARRFPNVPGHPNEKFAPKVNQ
jgi:hypothetical protein